MKMVIWSAAMLATAAGSAFADKQYSRETGFTELGSTAPGGAARAGTVITVPVGGINSVDGLGSVNNAVINIPIFPGAKINGIGWDVTLTAGAYDQPQSWLSELSVAVTNSAFTVGGLFSPGFNPADAAGEGGNQPGQGTYAVPVTKWLDWGFTSDGFNLDANGILRLEFYEYFNDGAGIDGRWKGGNLYIQYEIPSPAGAGLLGLAGIAALGRKRRA